MKEKIRYVTEKSGGGDAVYGLGMIGAFVYYMQSATTFGSVVLGILKAIVWPAFVIHALMKFLSL